METLAIVVGVVSATLAVVAIWISMRSYQQSSESHVKTYEALAEVRQAADSIKSDVKTTQSQLLDMVREAIKPSDEEMVMRLLQQNPGILDSGWTCSRHKAVGTEPREGDSRDDPWTRVQCTKRKPCPRRNKAAARVSNTPLTQYPWRGGRCPGRYSYRWSGRWDSNPRPSPWQGECQASMDTALGR